MIDTRVWIDHTFGPFEAKYDPTNDWNRWLRPYFTLDSVRKIAARTQDVAEECGYDSVDTVHVIDGGTDQGEPRVVVLLVRWQHFDAGAESATSIIQPDAEGLYGIGGGEWTWQEAPDAPAAPDTFHGDGREPAVNGTDRQWLADAEGAYARRQEASVAHKTLAAVDQAHRINRALDGLGITPVVTAVVPAGRKTLTPALLVEADPEEELYSVYADWDETEGRVRLALGHYWGDREYFGQRPGRLLTAVDDVVEARREGPTPEPEPKSSGPSTGDLRKIAEDAARNIPSDVTSHDAGEITQLLSGLAAAVLCLADTVTRASDRP